MPGSVPSVNEVLQVRAVCYTDTQIAENIFHYRVSAVAGTGANLLTIALAFDAIIKSKYRSLMPSLGTYLGIGATNLTYPRSGEATTSAGTGGGTATGGMLPNQVAMIVTLRTALAGPAHRGRFYPGFIAALFADSGGLMNAAGLTALTSFTTVMGLSFTAGSGGNTATLALCIRNAGGGTSALPIANSTDVTQLVPQMLFATQKRRGQFGKTNTPPIF